jgi:MtaA/CmuA family methyltransferase
MNGYERYMAMARGEAVDFLPRVPILMQFAAEYIGSNYGAFASDFRVLVESNVRCAADFDFDQVSCISDPYRETHGFGAEVRYVHDGVPRCVKPPLADTKDLSTLAKPDPYASERMFDRVRAAEAFKEQVGGQYSILGWIEGPAAEAGDVRGLTNFLMDLYDDVPFVTELMDLCVEAGIAFALAQISAGCDTIGLGDAIASQVSPEIYGELIFPREKRLVDAVHEAGALVRLHICGDINRHMDTIAGLGVDLLDCDWQVDMGAARATLGPDVTLTGKLDPVAEVKDSTPEAIEAAIRAVYDQVRNRFMTGAGCEIPAGTAEENLKALCRQVPYVA